MLNQNLPFDQNKVQILDQLVTVMYDPLNPQRIMADKILSDYKVMPDSWLHTDIVVETSTNPNSKFLALSILEEAINVSIISTLDSMESASRS